MLFVKDYVGAACRMIEEGETLGGRAGSALMRLAGVYLGYAASGLQTANDNDEMAMGESFPHALPRPH